MFYILYDMKQTHAQTPVLPSLEQAIQLDASLSYFELGMTAAEKSALKKLTIQKSQHTDTYELPTLKQFSAAYLQELGNSAEVSEKIGGFIARMAEQTREFFKADKVWVALRASQRNPDFDLPRWHIDGYYFQPYKNDCHKVALALKGTATLFNTAAGADKKSFVDSLCRGAKMDDMEHRKLLNAMLDPALTETPPPHHGAVFVAGSEDRAAIHSEPPITGERLFISIVPGTAEQIDEHANRPVIRAPKPV